MKIREQVRPWRKKVEVSAETPGGAAETVQNIEAKFFVQGWRKITPQKNKINILSKNSIGKYDVIIN